MNGSKCEAIIRSRAENGNLPQCGKPASKYHLAGCLGFVATTLCRKHADAVTQTGYRLVPLDGGQPVAGPKVLSTINIEEPASEIGPLFTNIAVNGDNVRVDATEAAEDVVS